MPGNPDYTYGDSFQELKPYMLYGDRSTGNPVENQNTIVQDLEYLQGMYPGHMKHLQEYVVSACDHLDYRNSPMYDEYPDRMLINQICDSICVRIREEGIITEDEIMGNSDSGQWMEENQETEKMDWEEDEEDGSGLLAQQGSSTWGPPPGQRPPSWGPGSRPPGHRPPHWGPPPGQKPPSWGPGPRPPYWGPPPGPKPPRNNSWLNEIISVLLLNEMHRRRCRTGRCK
ncbi:hypothetical protein AALB39_12600 [Lachnospiraceae bacterium 54-53]